MPKAVLQNGEVRLTGPIPSDWTEGQELWVEEAGAAPSPTDIDLFRELNDLCETNDPSEDARFKAALEDQHREAKEFMRRRVGLP
jgi:hypothetical protein